MVPVPFRLKVPGQDRSVGDTVAWTTFRVHGLASLGAHGLRLDWSGRGALDSVSGMDVESAIIALPVEHQILPLRALRSIQLAGGWLRPRITITANELDLLRSIPSEHEGRIELWLARGDRKLASLLVLACHEAARQARLAPGATETLGPPTPTH